MALTEKKKKAIAAAVAYYIEEEENAVKNCIKARNLWVQMGAETIMYSREIVQRRGRMLPVR